MNDQAENNASSIPQGGLDGVTGYANAADPRATVDCDRECWVKDRIITAIRMAGGVKAARVVRADDDLLQCALDGIANGAAVEIIRTLGMEPEFVNLRRPPRAAGGGMAAHSHTPRSRPEL